ncbi:MAG: 4'-phosphopantetheinyl transferase superfamily protein [Gammaproteobacteria bacterium]|nr:MAG: 4'-phosphopantetheinyl transferase superfamily protein [Gammaproteobacteria bacterium]
MTTEFSSDKMEKLSIQFSPLIDLPITAAESISPQGVDIWLLDLASIDSEAIEKFSSLLSQDELERAQQFRTNRHHFMATRVLLRKTLSRYTRLNAERLLFSRGLQGKPFLANSPVPLYFNLSHSRNFAALAVSSLGDVGIDIENTRQRDYLKIVERFFHPDEHKQLLECDETKREQLFYKMWTLKEAFFKALGTGISTGLDKARFYFDNNNITAQFSDDLPQGKSCWKFHQTILRHTVTSTTLVALAVDAANVIEPHWFDGNYLLDDSNR